MQNGRAEAADCKLRRVETSSRITNVSCHAGAGDISSSCGVEARLARVDSHTGGDSDAEE